MTTFSKAYRAVVNDWSCVSFNWRIKGWWCNHMNPASLKTRPSLDQGLVQPSTAAGSRRTMKIINWSFAKFCPAARNSVDNSVAAKFTPTFTFLAKVTLAQFSLLSLSETRSHLNFAFGEYECVLDEGAPVADHSMEWREKCKESAKIILKEAIKK